MSRKANISATEKAAFGRPRIYAVRAHYGPLDKQPDQFAGAVVGAPRGRRASLVLRG